ncbi:MAG: hypothetical protein ABEJ68_11460 [Halobacteriaceae archaeon]
MTRDRVFVTAGLLDVLLTFARDADPNPVTVSLVSSPADDWADLPPETPVFADFYFPDAGRSIRNVFGIDLGTPPTRGGARFLSHPAGDPDISRRDDLAARVLVAVPPWERENVVAYRRDGTELAVELVDAAPPERQLE